jgi:hypothetical protein
MGHWQAGPATFLIFFKIFHLANLKFKKVTFSMSKIHQILHRDSWKKKEQLSFLEQLQTPKGLQAINSGIN